MSIISSLSISDGICTQSYSHKKSLTEMEYACIDCKGLADLPSPITENTFKILNLPLRANNLEFTTISFIVFLSNTVTNQIYGMSLDPHVTLPRSPNSITLEYFPATLHPVSYMQEIEVFLV